jgi:chromosome partitioning protein
MTTNVISTINLKGGVGKTQMTIALSEFLAAEHGKKVLLIDLDPQTNATVALIDENVWLAKDNRGETLLQLFKDKLDKTTRFDIRKAIIKRASNVGGGLKNLDLLPSSLGLIEIQDTLPLISARGFFVTSPVTILDDVINEVLDEYEFVLIDCPPNLGVITLNGVYISDYFIIPCVPDILSTYGIPQILTRMRNFKKESKIGLEPLGIVISMYRAQSRLHDSVIRDLKDKASSGRYPRIFNTVIPLTVRTAEAADYKAEVNTLKQKYGYGRVYEDYQSLASELLKYV